MDARSLGLALEIDKESRRKDPLRYFEFASWAQERMVREAANGEVLICGANQSGKTRGGAAFGVALARGESELAGVPMPAIQTPNIGWIVVPGYKQAQHSVVKAYRTMIGAWPHIVHRQNKFIVGFYIKPNRPGVSDNPTNPENEWSTILLMPDEGVEPTGGRIDWVHGDEPPSEAMWREIRWRGQSGLPFYRFITMTPKRRIHWQWIKDDFEGSLGKWHNNRLELRVPIYDNRFLTPKDIENAEREAAAEGVMGAARLRGEYVDDSGDCPFDRGKLEAWMAATVPGKEVRFTVVRMSDAQKTLFQCLCEEWEPPDPTDVYLGTLDVGKGIDDGKHDPDCLQIWSRRKRKLVFRFNGYLGGYGLGRLAGQVGRRYGRAEIDPAVTGGYGEAVLTGLADEKYTNLARDTTRVRPGAMSGSVGYDETRKMKNAWRGAVERALLVGDVTIPSREVVQCFMDLVVDANGRIMAGPRAHDEDWSCAGRAIERLSNRPTVLPRERPGRRRNMFKRILGQRASKILDAW